MQNAVDLKNNVYGPLCQIWEQRIQASRQARERFDLIRNQCMQFYDSTAGFMWEDDFNQKHFGGNLAKPKFCITLNKAFEFVSIYGPSLFWRYPARKVFSQRTFQLTPELIGDMELFQQLQQQDMLEQSAQESRNNMMESYLNWSQREQPQGLQSHAVMAITDALLSGRGCLWPETYEFDGSETPYTKLQYDSVANLFIDADCRDPHLETAGYIMRRHVNATWAVERMFELPKGSLSQYSTKNSFESQVRSRAREENGKADASGVNKNFDCIEWYEIWSKVGVGPRMNGAESHVVDHFDRVIGDYAYLCIAPGVPFPLNTPADQFYGDDAYSEEEVRARMSWRAGNLGQSFPIWKDNSWPVALLDFNPVPGSPYPMAPLGPGIGELMALNILMSAYVDQAWENRKTILAYYESSAEELTAALNKDSSYITVPMNDSMQKSIGDMMQILQRPEMNQDLLMAINVVSEMFDRRVGLNELMYGNQGSTQIRVAADIRERSARSMVRPDKMGNDVAKWMSDASRLEMFLAIMHVDGSSLRHLLGEIGSQIWNDMFEIQDLNDVLREMSATVEASEIRRPSKETETANIQSLQQYLLPVLQLFAQETGNTEPFNGFLEKIGEAMEMDTSQFAIPEWRPETDPEQAQLQQMAQQLELQKAEAEVSDKQAAAGQKQAQAQKLLFDTAVAAQESGVNDGDIRELEHEQKLRHNEEEHSLSMMQSQDTHLQQLLFDEANHQLGERIKAEGAVNTMEIQREQAGQ